MFEISEHNGGDEAVADSLGGSGYGPVEWD